MDLTSDSRQSAPLTRFVFDNPCSQWAQVTHLGGPHDHTFRIYLAPGGRIDWNRQQVEKYKVTLKGTNGYHLVFHAVRSCSKRIELVVTHSGRVSRNRAC